MSDTPCSSSHLWGPGISFAGCLEHQEFQTSLYQWGKASLRNEGAHHWKHSAHVCWVLGPFCYRNLCWSTRSDRFPSPAVTESPSTEPLSGKQKTLELQSCRVRRSWPYLLHLSGFLSCFAEPEAIPWRYFWGCIPTWGQKRWKSFATHQSKNDSTEDLDNACTFVVIVKKERSQILFHIHVKSHTCIWL